MHRKIFHSVPDTTRQRAKPESGFVHIAYEDELERSAVTRDDFRETWLFDLIKMNHSFESYSTKIPHSITTWSVSAMSLSTDHGLCLLQSPIRVTSFKPMFMQVVLPYSVVQYEQVSSR